MTTSLLLPIVIPILFIIVLAVIVWVLAKQILAAIQSHRDPEASAQAEALRQKLDRIEQRVGAVDSLGSRLERIESQIARLGASPSVAPEPAPVDPRLLEALGLVEPAPIDHRTRPGDALREIRTLAQKAAESNTGVHRSFAKMLAAEAESLMEVSPSSPPETIAAKLYDPSRPIDPSRLSGVGAAELRGLMIALDEQRRRIASALEASQGVAPILPIPLETPFDPDLHQDVSGSPGITLDPAQDNVVVELRRPGVTVHGRPEIRAKVVRVRFQSQQTPASEPSVIEPAAPLDPVEPSLESKPRKATEDVGW
jgi:hypothetical protein